MARKPSRALALTLLAALVVGAVQAFAGLDGGVLHLVPVLALFVPLMLGRYVGEERLVAVAEAYRARRPRAIAVLTARLPRAPRVTVARGAALLAAGLAQRGPPAVPATAR